MWQDILKTINITAGKTKTVGMPIIEEDDSCKEKFMKLKDAIKADKNLSSHFFSMHFTDYDYREEDYCELLELFNIFVKKSDVMYNEWKDIKVHGGDVRFEGFYYTTTYFRALQYFHLDVFNGKTNEQMIRIDWHKDYTPDFINLLKRYL